MAILCRLSAQGRTLGCAAIRNLSVVNSASYTLSGSADLSYANMAGSLRSVSLNEALNESMLDSSGRGTGVSSQTGRFPGSFVFNALQASKTARCPSSREAPN